MYAVAIDRPRWSVGPITWLMRVLGIDSRWTQSMSSTPIFAGSLVDLDLVSRRPGSARGRLVVRSS